MKKLLTTLCFVPMCITSINSFAHNIKVAQTLPVAKVANYGELVVENAGIVYKTWQSERLAGKVRVIQAIAGRRSAKALNAPLMSAITAQQFDKNAYQTTTIINQNDAVWGTSSFVKSSAKDSKKEFSWSSIVLDEDGTVAKAWQLKNESSFIAVLNKQGQVLFAHEGALSQEKIAQVLKIIKDNI